MKIDRLTAGCAVALFTLFGLRLLVNPVEPPPTVEAAEILDCWFDDTAACEDVERPWPEEDSWARTSAARCTAGAFEALASEAKPEVIAPVLRDACEMGRGDACTALGVLTSQGLGVAKDREAALALHLKGCGLDSDEACMNKVALAGFSRAPIDRDREREAFRDACLRGVAPGCARTSFHHDLGCVMGHALSCSSLAFQRDRRNDTSSPCRGSGDSPEGMPGRRVSKLRASGGSARRSERREGRVFRRARRRRRRDRVDLGQAALLPVRQRLVLQHRFSSWRPHFAGGGAFDRP